MNFLIDLKLIISKISDVYQNDELAYLSLTSKIEIQLRDKIAFELHQIYHIEYLICREWKSSEYKNHRVDLAIIEISSGNPVCLIEFKAKSVIRFESEFTMHLQNDLNKISKIAQDDNVKLYYIFFNNMTESENKFESVYNNSVKYISLINKNIGTNIKWLEQCKSNWERHVLEAKLINEKSSHLTINAGNYYNCAVTVETFIYGPIKKSDIQTLHNS